MVSLYLLLACSNVYRIGAYAANQNEAHLIQNEFDFYNDNNYDHDEYYSDYSDYTHDTKEPYIRLLKELKESQINRKKKIQITIQPQAMRAMEAMEAEPAPFIPAMRKHQERNIDSCVKGSERIELEPIMEFMSPKPIYFQQQQNNMYGGSGAYTLNNLWQMKVFSMQTINMTAHCLVKMGKAEMMRSIVAQEQKLALSVPYTPDDIKQREDEIEEIEAGKRDVALFSVFSLGLQAFDGGAYSHAVVERALNNAGYDLLQLNIKIVEDEREKRTLYLDNGHPNGPMELCREVNDELEGGKKQIFESGYKWLRELLHSGHFLGFMQNAKGNRWTAIRPIQSGRTLRWYYFNGLKAKPKRISAATVLKFVIDIGKNKGYNGIVIEGY